MSFLKVENVSKVYDNGVHALDSVSFSVEEGDFLAVIGLSGSGKSTLLRCINSLIPSTAGSILFDGEDTTQLSARNLRKMRKKIGMIFQHFNLIPRRSVLTNVLSGHLGSTGVVAGLLSQFKPEDIARAEKMLDMVGLREKSLTRSDELSGGQQQRVAIARALMQDPNLILADEPVASLDPATSHSVMDYLEDINKKLNKTVICNLHFLSLVRRYATRVIALKEGKLVFEGLPKDVDENWFRTIYGEQAKEVGIH